MLPPSRFNQHGSSQPKLYRETSLIGNVTNLSKSSLWEKCNLKVMYWINRTTPWLSSCILVYLFFGSRFASFSYDATQCIIGASLMPLTITRQRKTFSFVWNITPRTDQYRLNCLIVLADRVTNWVELITTSLMAASFLWCLKWKSSSSCMRVNE
jgi:hypothetical protein